VAVTGVAVPGTAGLRCCELERLGRQTMNQLGRAIDAKEFLLKVELRRERIQSWAEYPFNIPAVRMLDALEFRSPVTFLIGDNGAGKSTLIEAIAIAWGFNPEGGSRNLSFATARAHSELHRFLGLTRGVRSARDGYFLRAESFFNVASEIERLDAIPALAPPVIEAYGGTSLHEQSHGESFMTLMMKRFKGRGLYILDEPEAALSPTRQLAFLARMRALVNQQSQFIVATHSPIIMAYPGARILMLESSGIREVEYEDTEHFLVSRRFLNNRAAMLRELFRDAE
jgi:predicted ATPase